MIGFLSPPSSKCVYFPLKTPQNKLQSTLKARSLAVDIDILNNILGVGQKYRAPKTAYSEKKPKLPIIALSYSFEGVFGLTQQASYYQRHVLSEAKAQEMPFSTRLVPRRAHHTEVLAVQWQEQLAVAADKRRDKKG